MTTLPQDTPSRFAEPPESDDLPDEPMTEPIVRRPDGYHWLAPDGKNDFGPFETYEDALADLHSADADAPEPGLSLREAEQEIGIADWIDPDTGDPAEGRSPPHLLLD